MTYSYNANDNVLSETLSGVMAPYGFTTQKPGASPYPEGYDSEDRFMRYIRAGVSEDILLSRSGIGNISSSTNNGTTISRTYNNVHALTAMGPATQAYDADGNATTLHTGVTVDWDDAGRVQAAHVSSSATAGIEGDNEYGYLDGKKLWRKITRGGHIFSHEVYIYDGPNRIADYTASQAATSPLRQRVFGSGIDSLVAIVQANGDVLTVSRNRQWSVVALSDNSNGSIAERYAYGQFGERTIYAPNGTTIRTSSNFANNYGYTSREHLPECGLMYFRARHYDQGTGEFVGRDVFAFANGNSLYRSPIQLSFLDPTGQYLEEVYSPLPMPIETLEISDGCAGPLVSYCGPDITNAFLTYIMATNLFLRNVDSRRKGILDGLWTLKGIGNNIDFYYKGPTPGLGGCGTGTCRGSVFFCGKCVRNTVPNNILFGYVAAALEVLQDDATVGAWVADEGWNEGREQEGAYDIGFDLWLWMRGNGSATIPGMCNVFRRAEVIGGIHGVWYTSSDEVSNGFKNCVSCGKSLTVAQVGRKGIGFFMGMPNGKVNTTGRGRL